MTKPILYKFVAVGDNHGDMVDKDSANELFNFCKSFKPHHKIHLGDCYDMRSLRQGATGKETQESLQEDLEWGNWFISNYKPTIFLYGNHEDRIQNIIHTTTNGIFKDFCEDLNDKIRNHLKENGCKKILPYHAEEGVYELGPISFVHGYSCGVRAVEEHAIHYAPPKGATVMGHIHSIQQTNARKFRGAVGFCGGCLCKKKFMSYAKNRLNTSKWGTGWIYGFVQGKDWKIWQAHKVGKKFIYSHIDL
jgi:hypothetical protein